MRFYLRVIIVSEALGERVVVYFQLCDLGKQMSRAHGVKSTKNALCCSHRAFKSTELRSSRSNCL